MSIPHPTRPTGFALPVTLFALVVVGALVTGGFFIAQQETRIGQASQRSIHAFYLTERGLSEALNDWDVATMLQMATWSTMSLGDTLSEGIWSVDVTRINAQTWFLDATGTITEGGAVLGGANRRMGMIAKLSAAATITPPAAVTIRGGFAANGAPNKVDGTDRNPPGWSAGTCSGSLTDKPGVLTDDAAAITATGGGGKGGGGGGGCPSQIAGSPCIEENAAEVDEALSIMDDADSWDHLVALADHSITTLPGGSPGPSTVGGECNASDPLNWGDPMNPGNPCGRHFPIIHIDGDVTMKGNTVGQGILLVDGTFTMSGTPTFYGIILVNGEFNTASGTPDIVGAVMAQSLGNLNGTPTTDYSSCSVEQSILNSSLMRMNPLGQRSWVDLSSIVH